MQVPESHRWATGRGVRIAIIDTGLDTKHPELRDRVVGIRNFVDRDLKAFNADVHGTAVAGIIAAASNNGVGLVGVAPDADVLGLKACWQSDSVASGAMCNTFTLAKALNFAIDQQVDVINLSLGGPEDPLLTRLVAKAMEGNTVVVGAVSPKWPRGFPAGINGVVAVSNSGEDLGESDVSTYLSAPGNQVVSARPRNEYDFFSGSSFSTAQVSGVSALIRQRKPDASARTIHEILTTTAEPDGRTANACRALARVVNEADCQ
jgi:subtilisin family serine protease